MRYCFRCRASFQGLRVCPRDGEATSSEISDPLLDGTIGDRYRILDRIASGGMGSVYRAAHTRIAAMFAVKVIFGDLLQDASMRARFQREAEIASCLQSRHIVRVVDFGETDGVPYLVMELLEGVSLSERIRRAGPLAPDAAVRVASQIARGLAHAHERGIVHRDLKSDNVMLVREDDEEDIVKLLDFGIARIRDGEMLTRPGQLLGTPSYMAPEQFSQSAVDARADLYALGVMLHEMIAGAPPFAGGDLFRLAAAHLGEPPRPLRSLVPSVSPALEAIVLRLLAKTPAERFPTARALRTALRSEEHPATVESVSSNPPRAARSTPPTIELRAFLIDPAIPERIRRTIEIGAPIYNRGDHAGCAALYRETAVAALALALAGDALAVAARLDVALARSQSLDSTGAAWALRYGFDDLLQAAAATSFPQTADLLARESSAAETIIAPRLAAGDPDSAGDFYLALAERLAAHPDAADAAAVLQLRAAVVSGRRGGAGRAALNDVREAVVAVGRRDATRVLPLPLRACPGLPRFANQIIEAIAAGAPAYNRGDAAACNRLFVDAAQAILLVVGDSAQCAPVARLLGAALAESSHAVPERAVWTLRRAFDELLAEATARSPG